jgi:hypothetical protein
MQTRDRVTIAELRELAERLPPGWPVTLPREALLEALAGVQSATGDVLTVAQIADRLRRSASTVRGWCEAGRFADAFKLNGRDWRVPVASLEVFLRGQRPERPTSSAALPQRRRAKLRVTPERANLGDWRGGSSRAPNSCR